MPEDFDIDAQLLTRNWPLPPQRRSLADEFALRTQVLRESGQDSELLAFLERAGLRLARLEEVNAAARDLTNRLQTRGSTYVRVGSAQLVTNRLRRLEVAVATAHEAAT